MFSYFTNFVLLSSLISVAVNYALFRIELNSEWFKTTFGSVVLILKGANQRCVLLLISGFGLLLGTALGPFLFIQIISK